MGSNSSTNCKKSGRIAPFGVELWEFHPVPTNQVSFYISATDTSTRPGITLHDILQNGYHCNSYRKKLLTFAASGKQLSLL